MCSQYQAPMKLGERVNSLLLWCYGVRRYKMHHNYDYCFIACRANKIIFTSPSAADEKMCWNNWNLAAQHNEHLGRHLCTFREKIPRARCVVGENACAAHKSINAHKHLPSVMNLIFFTYEWVSTNFSIYCFTETEVNINERDETRCPLFQENKYIIF